MTNRHPGYSLNYWCSPNQASETVLPYTIRVKLVRGNAVGIVRRQQHWESATSWIVRPNTPYIVAKTASGSGTVSRGKPTLGNRQFNSTEPP